ncbi:GTP 3',8-cyclase MoaA [Desulfovibrio sp.]|uniref:GTP 3',8-cyclase MoaA n=1 Tax=Desulfovibrio sp. TaxID=885 RepID=UPI0023D7850B|nr:GTP 3',8-cyclase MoaA [Desulfovibrio sp.]MDE7240702.1 GTP 3',8-cyclase MoaA [Desulfovibrio sp.]
MLPDRHGRIARYLRVSVTDRCNFHCSYCRSADKERPLSHERILRYEEILRLVDIAVAHGIRKVRVTGGEPFMRKDCDAFLVMLRKRHPGLRLAVTSNGSLLAPHIPLLRALGVSSVNLSLDAFDREVFARITGRDEAAQVLAALEGLLRAGLRVKLNAVALRGVTEGQLDDFIHAAMTMPLDVRFIELMPLGGQIDAALLWPVEEVRDAVASRVRLLETSDAGRDAIPGPARMFALKNGLGRIGFIAATGDHACARCNRLRLTSDGALRTCLFSGREYRLAGLLRHTPGLPDERIARVLRLACLDRPLGEALLKADAVPPRGKRPMNALGG